MSKGSVLCFLSDRKFYINCREARERRGRPVFSLLTANNHFHRPLSQTQHQALIGKLFLLIQPNMAHGGYCRRCETAQNTRLDWRGSAASGLERGQIMTWLETRLRIVSTSADQLYSCRAYGTNTLSMTRQVRCSQAGVDMFSCVACRPSFLLDACGLFTLFGTSCLDSNILCCLAKLSFSNRALLDLLQARADL